MTEPFLKPRLTGGRFESHEIPLEVLRDWAAFEDMVIEVAKWKFLDANPTRSRSPRGFLGDVSLKLAAVENGSAVPVIVLSLASAIAQMAFTSPERVWLEDSRDSIVAAIGAAQHGKAATDHLPARLLDRFRFFGRSLRDDEAFEFPTTNTTVKLTKETRHRLVEASLNNARIVIRDISLTGTIPEADQDRGTFQLQLDDGQKFVLPDLLRNRDTVLEAFNKYNIGAKVRLRAAGRFGAQQKLEGIESLDFVRILEPRDVAMRVENLKNLTDGWLNGEGKALSPDGLDWFALAFDNYFSERLQLPFVYPTVSGGIRAEWTVDAYEASLEIDVNRRSAEWHELNLHSDADSSKTLDLNKAADWDWVVGRIEAMGGQRSD